VDEKEAQRREILAEMARRFTTRTSLLGDKEYRPINEPERVVFVDRQSKLTTASNAPDVAKTMVNLARAKGWETLHLKGSPEFKAHAWVEASLHGLKVTGYQPTEQDRERLATRMQDHQRNTMQQPEGAPQPQQAPQQAAQQPAQAPEPATQREQHTQQLLQVLQLAMRDGNVPTAIQATTLQAAKQRLDTMAVLPQVQVFDAQVRTQAAQVHVQQTRQHGQHQHHTRTH
jgi:hypothetical protein